MNRRDWLRHGAVVGVWAAVGGVQGCAATAAQRGTGDLGVVVGRADGTLTVIDTSARVALGTVRGLGDLSHASVVFGRDGRFAYVFGRDGALTRVDLLAQRITHRIQQAGNSIGGAISDDGTVVAAQNYDPGGVKVFDAHTLQQLADIPAEYAPGCRSRVVGLADLPGRRFVYSLFDADAIWVTDCRDPSRPVTQRYEGVGRQPYDALVTPNGRHYIAGLFGEDGLALIDFWQPKPRVRRILDGYGRGQALLPVYKMPHLRGWAVAGRHAYLPAIGRHEVLVVDTERWEEVGRIAVAGQPVFVMARPDGRQVWVNFALPHYHQVQVIDTLLQQVVHTLKPGRAVMHMEFTPRSEAVWVSCRDDHRVVVYRTDDASVLTQLPVPSPSGIFFAARAMRTGL